MISIYIASRSSSRLVMRHYRRLLQSYGHQVNTRWLDRTEEDDRLDAPAIYAHEDLEDILRSDLFILDNNDNTPEITVRGGRYVELGFVLGYIWIADSSIKRIWLVGPRTNVFTYLQQIQWFDSWDGIIAALGG